MENIIILFKFFLCSLTGFFYTIISYSFDSNAIENQSNLSIKALYHRAPPMPNSSMSDRIVWFSSQFKGVKYQLGALGEGSSGYFDQFPRYRVDAFDCETYVDTVIALSLSTSLNSFQTSIQSLRYKDMLPYYTHRNHFTSFDWNQNNQKKGILKDITQEFIDEQNHPVALIANTIIDIPAWYSHKAISSIRLQDENKIVQEQRLLELKDKGNKFSKVCATIPYIPLSKLFIDGKPNMYLFSQIPQGAIIEIVRPNWDLRKQIGIFLDVSHMGFAIWIKRRLYYREASSLEAKIIDIPMTQYLNDALKSPTIKGINVQIVQVV